MRWTWIDRFVDFESGKSATAVKNLSLAEDHFADHFPGFPVMPATLILEGLAQTGGILVGEANRYEKNVVLAKMNNVRVLRDALAGEQLTYTATVVALNDTGAQVTATARSGNELLIAADIMFAHVTAAQMPPGLPTTKFVFDGGLKNLLLTAEASKPPAEPKAEPTPEPQVAEPPLTELVPIEPVVETALVAVANSVTDAAPVSPSAVTVPEVVTATQPELAVRPSGTATEPELAVPPVKRGTEPELGGPPAPFDEPESAPPPAPTEPESPPNDQTEVIASGPEGEWLPGEPAPEPPATTAETVNEVAEPTATTEPPTGTSDAPPNETAN